MDMKEVLGRLKGVCEMMEDIERIVKDLEVSEQVAHELWHIAGGDVDAVIRMSNESGRLSECKAKLIDWRFIELEKRISNLT